MILSFITGVVVGVLLVVFFYRNNKNTIARGSDALHEKVDPIVDKIRQQ